MAIKITSDSRKVRPGWTFFAIEGEKTDGHNFIHNAIERGAIKVVAQRPVDFLPSGVALEVVRDTRLQFYETFCCEAGLNEWDCCSIGVTGTNGKTSISFIAEFLLGVHKTMRLGTVNYSLSGQIIPALTTTPGLEEFLNLLYQAKEIGLRYLVMEVSSHSLVQRRIGGFRFDVGVFTNLSRDHLDYHRTEQDYYQAKRRLFFEHIKENGIGVINCQDRWGKVLYKELKQAGRHVVGIGEEIQVELVDLSLDGSVGRVRWNRKEVEISIGLIGMHNVMNAVETMVAVHVATGEDLESLSARLRDFPGIPGRMEKILARDRIVFIDYAHTPDGLENVLKALREVKEDRNLLCVFGCGGDRDKGKRPIMGKIADKLADVIIITSDNPRGEDPERIIEDIVDGISGLSRLRHIIEPDRYRAIRLALEIAGPGDIVLIAGKGHEDYQIVGDKRYHFSDKEVVLEWANSE